MKSIRPESPKEDCQLFSDVFKALLNLKYAFDKAYLENHKITIVLDKESFDKLESGHSGQFLVYDPGPLDMLAGIKILKAD